MSQQNRTTLKSYLETGDKPTQAQFSDLIDSMLNFLSDGYPSWRRFGEFANQATTSTSQEVISSAYTVPADSIDTNGQVIRVHAWGAMAGNTNAKGVGVKIDGVTEDILFDNLSSADTSFYMQYEVLRSAAGQGRSIISAWSGNQVPSTNNANQSVVQAAPSIDYTTDFDIEIVGFTPSNAGDLTLSSWFVELLR